MKRRPSNEKSVEKSKKRSREHLPNEDMEGPSQSSQPQLCRTGCGFYGSSKTDGMCSKCYKDSIKKKNNSGRKSPGSTHTSPKDSSNNLETENITKSDGTVANALGSLAKTDTPSTNGSTSSADTSPRIDIPQATNPATSLTSPSPPQSSSFDEASTSFDDSNNSSPSKPKKNRCATCRKRLGLTGFYCRCGKIFCSLHRYSDQHECDFDYKADAQAKIRKENPVVVGEKINKI